MPREKQLAKAKIDDAASPTKLLVEMRGIEKAFLGVRALSNARFDLRAGEVHALIGENGAGKSTLMKILMGVYQPDAGQIFVDGKQVDIPTPRAVQDLGISIIHQELHLMNHLTAAQNTSIGRSEIWHMCQVIHFSRWCFHIQLCAFDFKSCFHKRVAFL